MFLTKNEAKDALLKLDWAEDDIDNYVAEVDHPKAERQDDKIAFPQLIIEKRCVVMDGKRQKLADAFRGTHYLTCSQADALKLAIATTELLPMESRDMKCFAQISESIAEIKTFTTPQAGKDLGKAKSSTGMSWAPSTQKKTAPAAIDRPKNETSMEHRPLLSLLRAPGV